MFSWREISVAVSEKRALEQMNSTEDRFVIHVEFFKPSTGLLPMPPANKQKRKTETDSKGLVKKH